MKRFAILLLAALAALNASAATRYVGKSGGCPHMTGKTCSTASTCGASFDTACCEPQQCDTASTSGGVCEVHDGVYAATTSQTINGYSNKYSLRATKTFLTFRAAAGESPIMDGKSSANVCFAATSSGNGLTWDGIDCLNYLCGSEGNRVGIGYVYSANGIRIRNTKITSAMGTGKGEFACGAIRLIGDGTDNIIVEDVDLSGHMGHAVIAEYTSGTSGILVLNATINETGQQGSTDAARTFLVKTTKTSAPIVFANIRAKNAGSGDNPILFMREISEATHVYLYNAECEGCANGVYGSFATQDNVSPYHRQTVDAFNTPITGSGQGVTWQQFFSAMRVQNNLLSGAQWGIRGYPSDSSTGSHNDQAVSTGTDKFRFNLLERSTSSMFHPNSLAAVVGKIDVAGTVQTTGTQSTRDAAGHLVGPLGIATNDPLGQGPGKCSITVAGRTLNCALDIDGKPRELQWAVGARQPGGTPPPVAVCGNGTREGSEVCDDGNTVTETACAAGIPTCAACRADCGAVLNLTGPVDPPPATIVCKPLPLCTTPITVTPCTQATVVCSPQ